MNNIKESKPRQVYFDIETSALRTRAWSLYDERAIKYDEDWKLLCFAWKEPNKKPHFVRGTERKVVRELWKLFDTYDVLVAHNGRKFDKKKGQGKFFEFGLTPPQDSHLIDTYVEAKKHFNLTSYKLNDLARLLGLEGKTQHTGFEMWEGCERGDEKAWALMEKYNKQDVILLEQVYERLLPWIQRTKPVWQGKACDKCKGKLQKRGEVMKEGKAYQRYFCLPCNINYYGSQVIERV